MKHIFTLIFLVIFITGYSQWDTNILKKNNVSSCHIYSSQLDSNSILGTDTNLTEVLKFDSAGFCVEYREIISKPSDVGNVLFCEYDSQNRLKTKIQKHSVILETKAETLSDTVMKSIFFYDKIDSLSNFMLTYKNFFNDWDNVINTSTISDNQTHSFHYSQNGVTIQKYTKRDSLETNKRQRWQFSKTSKLNLLWDYTDTLIISTVLPSDIYLSIMKVDNEFDSTNTAFNYFVEYHGDYISITAISENELLEFQVISSNDLQLRTMNRYNKLPNGLTDSSIFFYLMEGKKLVTHKKYIYF